MGQEGFRMYEFGDWGKKLFDWVIFSQFKGRVGYGTCKKGVLFLTTRSYAVMDGTISGYSSTQIYSILRFSEIDNPVLVNVPSGSITTVSTAWKTALFSLWFQKARWATVLSQKDSGRHYYGFVSRFVFVFKPKQEVKSILKLRVGEPGRDGKRGHSNGKNFFAWMGTPFLAI